MFTLTKAFRFEASHQLMNHDGKCKRLHGHSWVGRIIIAGPDLIALGPKAGMLMDYGDLSKLIEPIVRYNLDHWHLNDTLGTAEPTSEFVARWVFEQVKPQCPLLVAVQIDETCTSSAEYRPANPRLTPSNYHHSE